MDDRRKGPRRPTSPLELTRRLSHPPSLARWSGPPPSGRGRMRARAPPRWWPASKPGGGVGAKWQVLNKLALPMEERAASQEGGEWTRQWFHVITRPELSGGGILREKRGKVLQDSLLNCIPPQHFALSKLPLVNYTPDINNEGGLNYR